MNREDLHKAKEQVIKDVYAVIKKQKCRVCGGDLHPVGFIGNYTTCLKCGLMYSTEILEEQIKSNANKGIMHAPKDYDDSDDGTWGMPISIPVREIIKELEGRRAAYERWKDRIPKQSPYLILGAVINYLNGYGLWEDKFLEGLESVDNACDTKI